MPRKMRVAKARMELTPAQLWELCTGFSVNVDHWQFIDWAEMVAAWHDHADKVRAWRDRFYPGDPIWIEEQLSGVRSATWPPDVSETVQ